MDKRSEKNLIGVHPDLVKLITEAQKTSPIPFIVNEGLRTLERQKEMVRIGASKTLDSRHLTGHAVDIAVIIKGKYYQDWPLYNKLGVFIKDLAKKMNIEIVWGGDWNDNDNFTDDKWRDGPHYELDKKVYPK